MSFTPSLPPVIALGSLAVLVAAEHILLPISLPHSAVGLALLTPLWLLAGRVADRRQLSLIAAIGTGIGLAVATVAATGLADLAIAPVIFLIGACLQILIIDHSTTQSTVNGRAEPAPSSRTDILMAQAADAANDLRLVR